MEEKLYSPIRRVASYTDFGDLEFFPIKKKILREEEREFNCKRKENINCKIESNMVVISNFGFIRIGNILSDPCYKLSGNGLVDAITLDDKHYNENFCKLASFSIDDTGYELIIFLMRDREEFYHFLIIQADGKDASKFKVLRPVDNININDLFLMNIYVCKHPIFRLKPYGSILLFNIKNIISSHLIGKLDMKFLAKLKHIFDV